MKLNQREVDLLGVTRDLFLKGSPEFIAQYYLSNDLYIYGAVNYDLLTKQGSGGWNTSNDDNNDWRWSIGIGAEF